MDMKKIFYIIGGCLSLGVGALGQFCPCCLPFPSSFWRLYVLPEVLRNFITGSLEPDFTRKTWKPMWQEKG